MRKPLRLLTTLAIGGLILGMVNYRLLTSPRESKSGTPAVIMVVLDPSLNKYAPAWRTEIARRFPNALAILVHGNEFVSGQFVSFTPMQPTNAADLCRAYKEKFPNRTIVLVSCNVGHLELGVPGVYYAHSSVWLVPDRGIKSVDDLTASLKLSDKLPSTRPTTRPTLPIFPEDDGIPFNPFDLIPTDMFPRMTMPMVAPPIKNRWESDPDVLGNIFEFKKDGD